MMIFVRRHKLASALGAVVAIVAIVMLATGIYVASVAGELPWQTDPTRVADSITPFADMGVPTVFVPSSSNVTPTPSS
jgi:hypothetical protein